MGEGKQLDACLSGTKCVGDWASSVVVVSRKRKIQFGITVNERNSISFVQINLFPPFFILYRIGRVKNRK